MRRPLINVIAWPMLSLGRDDVNVMEAVRHGRGMTNGPVPAVRGRVRWLAVKLVMTMDIVNH